LWSHFLAKKRARKRNNKLKGRNITAIELCKQVATLSELVKKLSLVSVGDLFGCFIPKTEWNNH